jgi:hypothetical protein
MNNKILTAKQARSLTENRDRTMHMLAEAIAEAAIAGEYKIKLRYAPHENERTELEKLYWSMHEYFSTYLRGLGYDVTWLFMTYDEVSWDNDDTKIITHD